MDKDHGHPNTCSPSDCRYACSSYAAADPPFRVDPTGGSKGGAGPVGPANAIMLVDRGPMDSDTAPCKFAEKVWNAQQAGAAGVLVVNFEDKHTTMEAPDDQDEVREKERERGNGGCAALAEGSRLCRGVGAGMEGGGRRRARGRRRRRRPPPHPRARALQNLITFSLSPPFFFSLSPPPPPKNQVSYKYLRNITIPAAFITKSDGQALKDLLHRGEAYVVMDWADVLPKATRVEWEFWSNSNDMCGAVCDVQKEFIKEFVPAARELDDGNWTAFTPHYIVWVCPPSYRDSDECKSQCTHHGRYCTPDPDGSIDKGYSGADIVAENLRQLCVFKLAAAAGRPWVWWDYVTRFGEECTMAAGQYGPACAERIFGAVGGGKDWGSLADLHACVGDVRADADNALMEAEMARQRGGGDTGEVYILPTLRINKRQYRGKLAYADVLRAICAALTAPSPPKVCTHAAGNSACRPGSAGFAACAARTDGKTKCRESLAGYDCECGSGYIAHTDANGRETCLNINECVSTAAAQLDPACTCDRCACKDTPGGYECLPAVPDECAANHGGCWHAEFTVRGKRRDISACHDRIAEYRDAAAHGRLTDGFPLSECRCPPCFRPVKSGAKLECVPKCDLDYCDEPTGVCSAAGGGAGGSGGPRPAWTVGFAVLAALAAVGGGGYLAYVIRLKAAMKAEVMSIMRQYMPLEGGEGAGAGGGGGGAAAGGGV